MPSAIIVFIGSSSEKNVKIKIKKENHKTNKKSIPRDYQVLITKQNDIRGFFFFQIFKNGNLQKKKKRK